MDFTPKISQTNKKTDRNWYLYLFHLKMFLSAAEEVDPKAKLGAPTASQPQPGRSKLHQKDVGFSSVAVPIQGARRLTSHPGVANGADLRKLAARGCGADANGN